MGSNPTLSAKYEIEFHKMALLRKIQLSRISPWRVVLVVLPPIILAWPLMNDGVPYPISRQLVIQENQENTVVSLSNSESPKQIPIQGGSDTISGGALFSALFKVETLPMPIELCLHNQNVIKDGNNIVDQKTLVDSNEAGAMDIKFHDLSSGTTSSTTNEVYAKIGTTNCKDLPASGALLDPAFTLRHPIPVKVATSVSGDKVSVNLVPDNTLSVQVYKNIGYSDIRWQWSIFITNFAILLFAWVVFLASCIAVTQFVKYRKNN